MLVGPVVKIDPATLPHAPNIHYFGQRVYADLPAFLSGWDVALLPFARNDATKFISPTKTLEYMAAGKPIVSTPITDVVETYGDVVELADEPGGFVAACERALGETGTGRAKRLARYDQILAATSWDRTAAGMADAMRKAIRTAGRGRPNPDFSTASRRPPPAPQEFREWGRTPGSGIRSAEASRRSWTGSCRTCKANCG